MKIKFCGAAQNVTGSQHLVEVNGCRILLDCGLFQGGDRERNRRLNEKFLHDPAKLDFVILSHAHIDHAGLLPRLVSQGFGGKIFCTQATRELAEVLLLDAAHIQQQDAEFSASKLGKEIIPLFTEKDVRALMPRFETFEYFQKFKISKGVWATFFEAGHVLGSAITAFDINEDGDHYRLVYTGDLGRKYLPILNDPYQVDHARTLIIESTYASHVHDSMAKAREDLIRIVNAAVRRGGKIIIPGFSFERTQELVYILHELYNAKKIPLVPIFVDSPLSSRISRIFDKYSSYYDNEAFRDFFSQKQNPLFFEGINYVEKKEESQKLNNYKGSCIIISSSGMCESGRIQHHLSFHMTNPNNLILIVGYMAEGTIGRQIVERANNIKLFGKSYPLRAEVAVMNSFSAHADKLELLEYIKNINDLEHIFIVHGEENECLVLRDNIHNILKFKGHVDVVDMGEEFEVKPDSVDAKQGTRPKMYLEKLRTLRGKA